MEVLTLESSLNQKEIEDNFKDFDLFVEIRAALKEALAYERNTK